MKRFITMLLLALTVASLNAMPYESARREALFMTDKMAMELGLNTLQFDAVYEINLDYLLTLTGSSGYYGTAWKRRNSDLQYVLTVAQYNRYKQLAYFYRPVTWRTNHMAFTIYDRYAQTDFFYYTSPTNTDTYRGGRNDDKYYYRGRNYSTPNTPPRTDMGRSTTNTRTTNTQNHGTWRDNTSTQNTGTWHNSNNNTKTTQPRTNNNNTNTKPATNNGHFGGKR